MTRHDDHYKDRPIQPIEAMEQVAKNAPDHERGLLAAMACKYLLRAGTKEEWRKDLEKASNYLYRALNGVWPWDVGVDLDEKWMRADEPATYLHTCVGCLLTFRSFSQKSTYCDKDGQCLCETCYKKHYPKIPLRDSDNPHPPRRDCGCAECEKSFPENCDGSPNVPPRDSGEALVGRECWVWFDDDLIHLARSAVVARFDGEFYSDTAGQYCREHAQPVELGHPDPGHPEYKGEP